MSLPTIQVAIRWEDLTPQKQKEIETEYGKIGKPDELDYDGEDGVLGTITIETI